MFVSAWSRQSRAFPQRIGLFGSRLPTLDRGSSRKTAAGRECVDPYRGFALGMSEITERSALVVAHPDDEALWFSSILERVERVVICFSDVMSRPDWSEGRRRAIAQLPISGVISLGLTESEAFNGADWRNPAPHGHGVGVWR